MYAGVIRSINAELLQRQLQDFSDGVACKGTSETLTELVEDGAIVSMTSLGSSPGGEVFYVSSEES